MDFFDFIFYFIAFIIFTSKFEINLIKPKICDLQIIDKKNIDKENIIFNKIFKINPNFIENNYFNNIYKINLYENATHIIIHMCKEIDGNQRILDAKDTSENFYYINNKNNVTKDL
jgi:hypothetical protein